MSKAKVLALGLIVTLLVLGYESYQIAYGSSSDTSVGTCSLEAPEIQYLKLTGAGSGTNISTIDVNVDYDLHIYVYDPNGTTNVHNVTVRMMVNPGVAIGDDTPDFDENNEYWFRFVDSDAGSDYDLYNFWNGSMWVNYTDSEWFKDASGSFPDVGDAAEVTFRWHLSKVVEYSSQWDFAAIAFDDDDHSDTRSFNTITCNLYHELSVADSTHEWATESGENNVALTTPADGEIEFTVITNKLWKIQAKGSGPLICGAYEMALANVKIHNDTMGSANPLTTNYVNVEGLTSMAIPSSESGTIASVELWISVPAEQRSGAYTYTLTLLLIEQ